jgi:putative NADPH-quinone reductase
VRIAVIQGHPDHRAAHFGHALAAGYAQAAKESGHDVRMIEVARLDFPLLRSAREWQDGVACAAIREAQKTIAWAEHLVIVFPLWLGDMPALLKAFFEQALRPGFAIAKGAAGLGSKKKLLKGKSARIVVTMGMPAFFYRLYFRAHSVKNLQRNILEFCGVSPVRTTLVGPVEGKSAGQRELWLAKVQALGGSAR